MYKLAVWNVVDVVDQVWVGKYIVDNLVRVAIPELIFCRHPLGCWSIFWPEAIIVSRV